MPLDRSGHLLWGPFPEVQAANEMTEDLRPFGWGDSPGLDAVLRRVWLLGSRQVHRSRGEECARLRKVAGLGVGNNPLQRPGTT